MKKVLIIAYYFPPMGLSGIQRTLKFVKYLPDYGWEPTVLTIAPHAYFAFDDSFLNELRDRPVTIWRTEPGGLFSFLKKRRTISLKNEGARQLINRLSQALFIPDNKIGWKKQAMKFLAGEDLSQFDLIYATAPPFTDHLLGVDIKRKYGKPLVVDFRDAWLEYPYHIYWTGWHRRKHAELERSVVESADAIVTTNEFMKNILAERYQGVAASEKTFVISQGFDSEDFASDAAADIQMRSDEINFVYAGVFYEDRDPLMLYRVLAELRRSIPDLYGRLRFYMVGYVQEEYRELARTMGVEDRITYVGYVEHSVVIAWLKRSDLAWFNIGARHKGYETVSPGKAFEYLGSRKPIMAIIPENEIRTILSGFDHTFIVDPEDDAALRRTLIELDRRKKDGTLPVGDAERISMYDRKKLTGKLAAILERASGG